MNRPDLLHETIQASATRDGTQHLRERFEERYGLLPSGTDLVNQQTYPGNYPELSFTFNNHGNQSMIPLVYDPKPLFECLSANSSSSSLTDSKTGNLDVDRFFGYMGDEEFERFLELLATQGRPALKQKFLDRLVAEHTVEEIFGDTP